MGKLRAGVLVFGQYGVICNAKSSQQLNRYNKPYLQGFSTIGRKREKLYWKGPSRLILLGKLESALKEHQVDEAWETFKDFKRLHGFPDQFLVANLITESSYSADPKCLRRACDLVLTISKEKSVLLRPEMMTKLALSLARAQIPVAASSVLRLMKLVVNKSAQAELTKPDVTIFNLVLDACVRFGSPLKGQQIIELMPQLGAIADGHTAIIIARIHEMNGMRDDLKKFKDYVDMVPVTQIPHYQQFYDCLLSLHFKFNDIDGASALLMDLCRCSESNTFQRGQKEQLKSCSVSIGSDNIRMGLRLQFLPQQLQRDFVYKVHNKQELILYKSGKFVLSNKGEAILRGFMEVIGFMMENNMFLDKWSYKTEFLKFHRDLYRTLTALEGKDEAQKRRIEHVHAFRKAVPWAYCLPCFRCWVELQVGGMAGFLGSFINDVTDLCASVPETYDKFDISVSCHLFSSTVVSTLYDFLLAKMSDPESETHGQSELFE
ncbi:UNVERIFIED_CONTAM: Pentatricopeptide repeat-containing protein [Sesamum calycinum]|uniref:Pentatricopeptide repeat-containing protein n=1 Tax=Sesamum calycinum TaxID=2727403 RepID=A0AAW2JPU5_9LAMI